MPNIDPTTYQQVPTDTDLAGSWGDNMATAPFQEGTISVSGKGLITGMPIGLGRMFKIPAKYGDPLAELAVQEIYDIDKTAGAIPIIYEASSPNTYKSIEGAGVTDDGKVIRIATASLNYTNNTVVSPSGGDYTTIQAANDAVATAALTQPQTLDVKAGTYTEEVVLSPGVSLLGESKYTVFIVGNIIFDNETSSVESVTLEHTPISGTDYTIHGTGIGSFNVRNVDVIIDWAIDSDIVAVRAEGDVTIEVGDLRIFMKKTASHATARSVIAFQAPDASDEQSILSNNISVQIITDDINDNHIGYELGGAARSHTSNYLFGMFTTNASYSGTVKTVCFCQDTTTKTFGDFTSSFQDAGAGTFYIIDVSATSGKYVGGNIQAFYEGSGTAYVANVASGATLHLNSTNAVGFTDVKTGTGTFYSRGLLNGVDITDADAIVNGTHSADSYTENSVLLKDKYVRNVGNEMDVDLGAYDLIAKSIITPFSQANFAQASTAYPLGITYGLTSGGSGFPTGAESSTIATFKRLENRMFQLIVGHGATDDELNNKFFFRTAIGGGWNTARKIVAEDVSGDAIITSDIYANMTEKVATENYVNSQPYFFLKQTTDEAETVSSTTYVSPGDKIS